MWITSKFVNFFKTNIFKKMISTLVKNHTSYSKIFRINVWLKFLKEESNLGY